MHKAFVYVDSTDEAGQAAVAAGVTEVLAVYGVRVLVRATEEQLRALEEAGFQVELADEMDRLTLPSVIIDTTAEPTRAAAPPPPGWRTRAAPDEPSYWLVQFVGPPLPEWVDAVRDAGAEIIGPMPENALLVRMTQLQADAVAQLDHVQWVGPYEPVYKIHPELIGEESPLPATEAGRLAEVGGAETRAPAERIALRITLFEPEALSTIVSEIESAGGTVEKADIDTIICELPRSAIPAIAALPAVAQIEPYAPPTLAMDQARIITLVQTNFDTHGLDGEGETVGVTDTGLDRGADNATLHQDFKKLNGDNGRVIGYGLGRPGRWDDPEGHGTHVSGIAVGNGRARGAARPQSGIAYKANLVIQSAYVNSGSTLGGLPANLNTLFEPVYTNDGVRVHNNSWGTHGSLGQYQTSTRQIDEFIWRNPDMVIVFAAGNSATDGPRAAPPGSGGAGADGVVDFGNVDPEGNSRNGITVGGSENNKPSISTNWRGCWGQATDPLRGCFWTPPISTDRVANNPEHIMAISGRGPTSAASGRRIKPDVLAPGSSILAPWSRLSPTSEFWGPRPNDGSPYIYKGGTSMAAPHVSGICALVRQYLRMVHNLSDPHNADKRRRRPSAALIKALLIHGARRVQGLNAANAGPVPSNHQGWGRVDLRRSLFSHPIDAVASQDNGWLPRRTIFLDDPDIKLNSLPAADPNSRSRHEVRVRVANNSVPLRATLVWTDYPGPTGHPGTLVNYLRLSIIRHNANGTTTTFQVTAPTGLLPTNLKPLNNNVQQIDVSGADLRPGEYTIRVDATNVASHAVAGEDQDFALVISGPISHSDHRSPGTMHALPDLAFIDLMPAQGGRHRHDGLAPSPERSPMDLGSPDIWVSREANSDPTRAVGRVEAGQKHYVYVRVHNLGFANADNAQIQLYWANPTTPMAYPADWKTDGIQVSGAPSNQITTNIPARDNIVVGPFEWTPPRGHNYLVLFARAVHPEDPIVREGDVRWDNNITRRDVYLQDNATEVQGEPSGWDKFIFWIISGFGTPRNIDAWIQVFYEDLRDGQVKPVPAGVKVEVWDYDPIFGDDKLAEGHTVQLRGPDGELTSAVRMTFSTSRSGERGPDLYCRVIKPSGAEFAEFIANSFFAAGADHWSSRSQTAAEGGFYEEDFSGDRLGIDSPLRLILRPTGIRIQAAFESYSVVNNEFEKLPAGIPVKIMDSNPAAPQPVLATVTTDENGEIRTSLPKREDYHPSIYFLIEKTGDPSLFLLVDYFLDQDRWDSRTKQGEVIASDGSVRTISGHFQNWTQDSLVGANERLRFRLEAPGIQMHLRFEYFDREAGGYRPLPVGTEVEVWEDDAAATQPLVTGTVGQNGRAELSVPKGGRDRLNLYARVVMRRRLSAESDAITPPTVDVRQGGNVIHWDTKGQRATDGTTAGLFTNVEARVPTTGGPLVFRIGTGATDATVEHAAPYILRVIGEVHDWLRTRTNGDWSGVSNLQVELFNSAAEGSKFDSDRTRISLNTGHTAPGAAQPDHWNREIIAHQYGHAVLETLYLDPFRTAVAVPNHRGYNPTDERDERLAFAEGWADYLANAHKNTPTRPDPTGHGWRGSDDDGTDNSGEIVPIAVANMLYQIDQEIVKHGHTDNSDPVNQRRFLALIWNPIQSLSADANRQVPYQLYRAIQSANLAASDLIPPHDITHIRQEVRRVFEQNGMVFTRGRIQSAARQSTQNLGASPPVPEVWRFQVRPVDQARLNAATMGRITAYRIQARRVGTADFVDLDPIVEVPEGDANQRATIDVNLTAARQAAALRQSGNHDFRVRARDEFGAWDTFADDFTGNTDTHGTGVISNDTWQRNRLHSIHSTAINVP